MFGAAPLTFVLAAAIILGIPSLGGGSATISVSGAMRRTWSIVEARSHLVIATLAALLIPMSYPALLSLAYQISRQGGQTYSLLEVVLSVGVFLGSVAMSRFAAVGTMRTVGIGLLLTGVFSVARSEE